MNHYVHTDILVNDVAVVHAFGHDIDVDQVDVSPSAVYYVSMRVILSVFLTLGPVGPDLYMAILVEWSHISASRV